MAVLRCLLGCSRSALLLLVVSVLNIVGSGAQTQSSPTVPCTTLLQEGHRSTAQGRTQRVWNASLVLPIHTYTAGWQMTLRFTNALDVFTNQLAGASSGDNRQFVLRAPDDTLPEGSNLTLRFEARSPADQPAPKLESVHFNGRLVCNGTEDWISPDILTQVFGTPRPSTRVLKYDYSKVIDLSLQFYEAQRSGLLPLDNRVTWRNDSCLNDRGNRGEDLTGGYFTSGRTLKFTFPNAAATTILAWGIINHDAGYETAGQLVFARDALNWGAAWLARCHTRTEELYVLVGDVVHETEQFWGRPEDIDFQRPAFAINRTSPGSEVAAEAAAALAASSVALRDYYHNGPELSALYLDHAKQLYQLAVSYRGDYSKAVPQVANFYKSWSGDEDELVWAALWLFRATGEQRYRNEAQDMYRRFDLKRRSPREFSWDEKTLGVRVLLSQMTLEPEHEEDARRFCDSAVNDRDWRTPKGLFHVGQEVGSIRYASNAAFICFELGELIRNSGGSQTNPYLEFAVRQVNYILGDTGRSFMVGFGNNWPKRVHHSAASCPNAPAACGFDQQFSPRPNPQVIKGGLVGGPDKRDNYTDSRTNWAQNEVAVDSNAGFQSLVAGLLALNNQMSLPASAYVR